MDKNTIIGIILMAVVFFGFMWLSPKQNETARNNSSENTEMQEAAPVLTPDSLSEMELNQLKRNIADYGSEVPVAGDKTGKQIADNNLTLTLEGDSVYGLVKAGDKFYPISQILSGKGDFTVSEQREAIETVRNASQTFNKYGIFTNFLSGTDEESLLENDVLKLRLDSKSGTITRAELKDYYTEYAPEGVRGEKRPVVIFEGNTNSFNFLIPTMIPIETRDLYFTPESLNDTTVRMKLEVAPGSFWGIEYTLSKGNSYIVKAKVVQQNMNKVIQSNNRYFGFNWDQTMIRQEKGRVFEERQSGLYYQFNGGDVEHLSEAKADSEERMQTLSWIGFKNQFFSTFVIPSRPFTSADFQSRVMTQGDYLKNLSAQASIDDYDWSSPNPLSFNIFIGPNEYSLLRDIQKEVVPDEDLNLTRVIPLGWSIFRWINTGVIIPVFNFLGKFIHSYGIIILILTIFIKLILFPLTYKSYVSQAKMRILQPDIQALRAKYPDKADALTLNQKTMELYRKAGANPMSGCLPLLLQMPILFAVFQFFPSCIQLRGQSFLWAHDLAAPDAIISWTGNIPFITKYFGNHISLFCLLMTAANIIYTYINTKSQPQTMPGMKWMMYLMPVFFLVFFNNYAAALSYYYLLSLGITIIQTYAIRYYIKEEDVRKKMAENAKKPRKKSGFMKRLEEMQRQQQQMMREQQKNAKRR